MWVSKGPVWIPDGAYRLTLLALENDEVEALVDRRGALALGVDERLGATKPARFEAFLVDAVLDQPLADGERARLGEALIGIGIFRWLDVDRDAQAQDLGMDAHLRADLAQQIQAVLLDGGLLEDHRLEELQAIGADDHERVAAIGTAILVVGAVDHLGLVRTLVVCVGDRVVVVVRIGATVEILEAVLVLGLARTLVLLVGN